jgi:hypothetical protein
MQSYRLFNECVITSREEISQKLPAFGTDPAPQIGVGVYVGVGFILFLIK